MKIFYLVIVCWLHPVKAERTILDDVFSNIFSNIYRVVGRTGEDKNIIKILKQQNKIQNISETNLPLANCDIKYGPGSRSLETPTTVHRLRPGDIDIVGALGDSLTAGWGILAVTRFQTIIANRGLSFTIGGQGDIQQFVTLPNILKEFNPNLYGYALSDSLTTERNSKFNVAEGGAMSKDMPYMAKILVKRLLRDPRVNMTNHWKMITVHVGNNDFCGEVCYLKNPEEAIDRHEQNMVKVYRYLRDNVPRLILNVIPAPNLTFLLKFKPPTQCYKNLAYACPCVVGMRSPQQIAYMDQLMNAWFERDEQIVQRQEFNTKTFTINVLRFFKNFVYPTKSNGETDFSYSSPDCFHVTQKSQAAAATSLWNNLFKAPEDQTVLKLQEIEKLYCPTPERPFIVTRVNKNLKV